MAKCPFAEFKPISGSSGAYTGKPFRIVHHTTEGSSASGAFAAFKKNRSDPHFTVDHARIVQHIDTAEGGRALANRKGGVQTNRHAAIQIEVVGFAGADKKKATLKHVARLCRWLEQQHGIPASWAAGPPKTHNKGKDPGGHKRDPAIWTSTGGHYGHSQVPENIHWDPGYSKVEADFILAAKFDADGELTNSADAKVAPLLARPDTAFAEFEPEVMMDHAEVGELEED